MLENAYLSSDDPYIIDSIGWLIICRRLFQSGRVSGKGKLMPNDPIVSHYGDILWRLNRKPDKVFGQCIKWIRLKMSY